jgi:2,4-dienoyl-CoA reductase-like NADH-dependent reductase (Old Yellow Enzyme family)
MSSSKPSTDSPTHLFSPFRSRGLTLRNRIGVSPMCQYSSPDGVATDWHLVHLGSRATGGAGLVMTEASGVSPEGRISPVDLGIWNDKQAEALAPIVRFVRDRGAAAGTQLAHAGRKASTRPPWEGGKMVPLAEGGWTPVGPGTQPFDDQYPVPVALDEAGIARVVADFRAAAVRAVGIGFDLIEIHAAHGYLLHSFLSPLTNQRTDRYGGSLENRMRFLVEVVQAIRGVIPDSMPLFTRISATDWVEGGWDVAQSVSLARVLGPLGVDLIDCSSAANVPKANIPVGPGYQVPLAEQVRRESGVPTAAVGMITQPAQADTIIRTGQADFVMLARAMLRNPYWPQDAAKVLNQEVAWPVQYGRARN